MLKFLICVVIIPTYVSLVVNLFANSRPKE